MDIVSVVMVMIGCSKALSTRSHLEERLQVIENCCEVKRWKDNWWEQEEEGDQELEWYFDSDCCEEKEEDFCFERMQ